jgi:hypothetical protein
MEGGTSGHYGTIDECLGLGTLNARVWLIRDDRAHA